MIDVFLSRPKWVKPHTDKQFEKLFYPLLAESGFNPLTIGVNVVPLATPFDDAVELMKECQCTIVLGFPQLTVTAGSFKGKDLEKSFSLPSEWNQIEAAISIMLNKPTLMMLPRGVVARGIFERGAAGVFVHEFFAAGPRWVDGMVPKLLALKAKVEETKVSG